MIRVYHRAGALGVRALVTMAIASLAAVGVVETFQATTHAPHFAEKLDAAKRAERAYSRIREEKVKRGLPRFLPEDSSESGLLGPKGSLIATSTGALSAKLTANNPNFAALLVDYFEELGLEKGDLVAVGYSGSFPGLNVAVLAAIDALGLEPIVISSAAASDHGASEPNFSWLDMERTLHDARIFRGQSVAASLGGIEDQAIGMSQEGRAALLRAIEESHAESIVPSEFEESIDKRLAIYDRVAAGRPIKVYVNVGGGAVSVGHSRGKSTYDAGINRPGEKPFVDSVIGRFLERKVPVVHLVRVATLARAVGLPAPPRSPVRVGEGPLFSERRPSKVLTLGCLVLLLALLVRLRRQAIAPEKTVAPQPR